LLQCFIHIFWNDFGSCQWREGFLRETTFIHVSFLSSPYLPLKSQLLETIQWCLCVCMGRR
jgi:hypothetical protein